VVPPPKFLGKGNPMFVREKIFCSKNCFMTFGIRNYEELAEKEYYVLYIFSRLYNRIASG
jgi:hypothetical protein